MFHIRSPSPWSGWSKPTEPISEPGGPFRISVVAASGSSFMSPSRITGLVAAAAGEQRVEVGAERGCLRGAPVERVGREAGALILVGRG